MRVPFVDLKAQYLGIKDEIDIRIAETISSSGFILSQDVERFEGEFSRYCGTKECVGVASGSDALFLSLKALGIGLGDEVITVPNTFISTVDAITRTGAKPVLVDIDKEIYNMDVTMLDEAITEKTRGIIPVHLYGQPVDMDPVMELAEKHNLSVVEDACQAHGARYKGRRTGSIGDIGCFSFYPGKNLGAYGDGGAIVTGNRELAEKITMMRNYGQKEKNSHEFVGYNSRLDGMQAAVLRVKLRYLDDWNLMRRENASVYTSILEGSDAATPLISPDSEHVFHLYVVRHGQRDSLIKSLEKEGISAGIHYPTPVHLQKAYSHLGYREGSFPVSEAYAEEILSLPMFPELTREQIEFVCEKISS